MKPKLNLTGGFGTPRAKIYLLCSAQIAGLGLLCGQKLLFWGTCKKTNTIYNYSKIKQNLIHKESKWSWYCILSYFMLKMDLYNEI